MTAQTGRDSRCQVPVTCCRVVRRPVSGLTSLDAPPSRGVKPSGIVACPHLFTVAGAAAGWSLCWLKTHRFPV